MSATYDPVTAVSYVRAPGVQQVPYVEVRANGSSAAFIRTPCEGAGWDHRLALRVVTTIRGTKAEAEQSGRD